MYTLIGSPKSRAFRVLWMLEELNADYQLQPVMPHSAQISAVNPSGKIPALLVDGQSITDSVAIIQFLADRHGALTHPAGSLERAKQDSFSQFFCDDLEGNCWLMAKHSFIYPESLRDKAALKPAAQWDIDRALSALEARIGDGPWLTGETFTVADMLLAHCAGWMMHSKLGSTGEKAAAIVARATARPGYLRAVAVRDER